MYVCSVCVSFVLAIVVGGLECKFIRVDRATQERPVITRAADANMSPWAPAGHSQRGWSNIYGRGQQRRHSGGRYHGDCRNDKLCALVVGAAAVDGTIAHHAARCINFDSIVGRVQSIRPEHERLLQSVPCRRAARSKRKLHRGAPQLLLLYATPYSSSRPKSTRALV